MLAITFTAPPQFTSFDLDLEHALQALRPGHREVAGGRRWRVGGLRVTLATARRGDLLPQSMVRRKDAVVTREIDPWRRHQRRQARAVRDQTQVPRRIPEKMDSALYYKTFRPYIRFFENVVYEGVDQAPINFRGETGAQSSVMPVLVAFMKIPHRSSILTAHLADLPTYMPREHRSVIDSIAALPDIRSCAGRDPYNEILDAMATFREVHFNWAHEYINRRTDDPRGTGGTPCMQWLEQLIAETRAARIR